MNRAKKLALILASFAAGASAFGAEEKMAPRAHSLFNVGPLPVTNSMITSWVVAIALIVLIRLAVRTPKLQPTKPQLFIETLVQGILDLTTPIVGKKLAIATFPILAGLFTFILIQNWSGLFPGVGTVMMRDHATGRWEDFVRPGNADLNLTFALSLVAIGAWLYFILRYAGPVAVIRDIFGNKADRRETPLPMYILMYFIFIFIVGPIEVVSIAFRPISLSFRLFGNVFGGENLMHAMTGICRWGLPIPFYFMEMLVGFVQAMVFMLLVSVYIGLICNHGDEHVEDGHS